jgi:CheY-like chemotaxis protein
MLKPLISEGVDLSFSLEQEPLVVSVNPGELQQVLTNLIINSRDALSKGGTITISTSACASPGISGIPEGPYCLLSVEDNGDGMDDETLQRLFEPFFTTKGVGKGTGLGLSMVHGIVNSFGGEIDVTSEVGEGSRFDVYLPRCDDADLGGETLPAHAVRGGSETLLLIEDEMQILELTAQSLGQLGYQLLTACNGQDAIEISRLRPGQVQLIVSDVIMPNKNGPEAVREILRQQPGAGVIFMSGYTDDIVLETGVDATSAILLRKPFSLDNLARLIRATLDEQDKQQAAIA